MLSPNAEPKHHEVHYPVLKLPKLELHFACGSLLWLRQINNDPLVRVIDHEGKVSAVDLRDLCPALEADYIKASELDRAGTIFFHLKLTFKTLPDFIAAAEAMPLDRRRVRSVNLMEVH